jgi:hypothetical protein
MNEFPKKKKIPFTTTIWLDIQRSMRKQFWWEGENIEVSLKKSMENPHSKLYKDFPLIASWIIWINSEPFYFQGGNPSPSHNDISIIYILYAYP